MCGARVYIPYTGTENLFRNLTGGRPRAHVHCGAQWPFISNLQWRPPLCTRARRCVRRRPWQCPHARSTTTRARRRAPPARRLTPGPARRGSESRPTSTTVFARCAGRLGCSATPIRRSSSAWRCARGARSGSPTGAKRSWRGVQQAKRSWMSGDPSAGFERTSKSGRASPAHTHFHPHAPTQQRLTAALALAGGGARRGARGGSRAGTPRPHLPLSVAASVCSARSRCMHTARTAPTSRPLHAHVQARLAARPPARPPTRQPTRPLHAHCTHLARTGTAHTPSPTRRGDSRRGARGDGTDDTDQEEGRTARGPAC